jgi:predicted Zn-ribbon and HTH transcriptional regulator
VGWLEVMSSVVQGSVLGSTLFNIYIDDIDERIKALLEKFAEDTKMAQIVEDEDDQKSLQADINHMNKWAKKWKMQFNIGKCKIKHIGKKPQKYEYKMEGENLMVTGKEKDLGVLMENNLKPNSQCVAAAKKSEKNNGPRRNMRGIS